MGKGEGGVDILKNVGNKMKQSYKNFCTKGNKNPLFPPLKKGEIGGFCSENRFAPAQDRGVVRTVGSKTRICSARFLKYIGATIVGAWDRLGQFQVRGH